MKLFSYKMTHDTGFAPNPFWGYLTLATCKPKIRELKCRGDWIAGFTSKMLCGDPVGDEKLVFLMQIEEKVPLADYFHDCRFQSRIPRHSQATVHRCGDNIYRPLVPKARYTSEFEQLPNRYHGPAEKEHDLAGRNVLIAGRSAYFGVAALSVPERVRPNLPRGQASHGVETRDTTRARHFIDYVFCQADAHVMAPPHCWPRDDSSWKTQEAVSSQQEFSQTEDDSTAGSRCAQSGHSPDTDPMSVCGKSSPSDSNRRSPQS